MTIRKGQYRPIITIIKIFRCSPDSWRGKLAYKSSGVEAEFLKRYGTDTEGYKHKGLLMGKAVAQLTEIGTPMLSTAMYYDNMKRMIQLNATNHLGGTEKE